MAESSAKETVGFNRRMREAMIQRTGHNIEFPSPNLMRLNLPGFPHNVFDSQGQKQIVCYLMSLSDIFTLYWPLPTKDKDEKIVIYTLNYELNLHQSLYDGSKNWPLVAEAKLNFVKRTSRCFQLDIRQAEQTMSMVSARYIEINVDSDTRRPKPFAQWWKDEGDFPEDGPKPEIKEVAKPRKGVLSSKRDIHFTDTDGNNHTNFAVYVRLCLDTFYEGVLNKKYKNSSPVFLNGWVKNMKITFKSETKLGDIVTVESWEDGEFPNTFYFEIRKGEIVATTLSLTFYSSLIESRL